MKLESTRVNHGIRKEIIMSATVKHEVAFNSKDIVEMLRVFASDDMAKLINEIGAQFNKDEFAQCYSSDDLNQEGKDFIEKMHYFINEDKEKNE